MCFVGLSATLQPQQILRGAKMQTMGLRNGRAVPMARRSIPAVPVRPGSIRRPLVVVNSGLANPPSSSNGASEVSSRGGQSEG